MRILLVSKIPPYFEQFWDRRFHFPNIQAQRSWVKALRALGHQVEVFRYSDNLLVPNQITDRFYRQAERLFPRLISRLNNLTNHGYLLNPSSSIRSLKLHYLINHFFPHAIIFSGGISQLSGYALRGAHSQGIPTLLLHGEHPQLSATDYETDHLKYFDWIITNDPDHARAWMDLGACQSLCLPYTGIDTTLHRRLKLTSSDKQQLASDVVFVGTLLPDRQQALINLLPASYQLAIYGYIPSGLGLNPRLKPYYRGEAWGTDAVKIYNAAKIALNFVPPHMPLGGNSRTFEIPGSGAFQLINRCPPHWFVPGKEIVIFSSPADLKRKITYYLNHVAKRRRIAAAGYRRAHQDHTYQIRFETLLQLI